ncbi:hypothetical protein [Pseudonocardia cypriaca]|uniref:hypothetical protein n=1 Tax=Pseudonocardia cypriaca TaxID=882449 RepID=UPI00115072AF|nr:hypothetical protein [Pseudonocardia cypriaca]
MIGIDQTGRGQSCSNICWISVTSLVIVIANMSRTRAFHGWRSSAAMIDRNHDDRLGDDELRRFQEADIRPAGGARCDRPENPRRR